MTAAVPEAQLRALAPDDLPTVLAIYGEGIATGHATFESVVPEAAVFEARFAPAPRLVAAAGRDVVGWACLGPISARNVYRGVGEVSVYVAAAARGQRLGDRLLGALIEGSEGQGFWTLQASIFAENEASLRLHARHGFRLVGRRERIGRMGHGPLAGHWRDTLLLERRSAAVGRN